MLSELALGVRSARLCRDSEAIRTGLLRTQTTAIGRGAAVAVETGLVEPEPAALGAQALHRSGGQA